MSIKKILHIFSIPRDFLIDKLMPIVICQLRLKLPLIPECASLNNLPKIWKYCLVAKNSWFFKIFLLNTEEKKHT